MSKENYYKYYKVCKRCGIEYGHDEEKDDGYCPICIHEIHSYKSRWAYKRDELLSNRKVYKGKDTLTNTHKVKEKV